MAMAATPAVYKAASIMTKHAPTTLFDLCRSARKPAQLSQQSTSSAISTTKQSD